MKRFSPRLRAALFFVLLLGFWAINLPLQRDYFHATGDVTLYARYARQFLATPPQFPREYPPLTAFLFALPQLITPNAYLIGWSLLALVATWVVVVLTDSQSVHGGWLLLYMCVGGLAAVLFRFDSLVVLLTVIAFVLARQQRWSLAQLCLALAAALKLYPVILMPLIVIQAMNTAPPAVATPNYRAAGRAALWGLVWGSALLAVTWWLAAPQLRAMLGYHTARPLQTEAIAASIAWLTGPVSTVWSFGSANLVAPHVAWLPGLLTPLQAVLLIAVYALLWRRRVTTAGAWALALLASIATSKVFSTQYILWVLPFIVLAGERRWLWLTICVATTAIYPIAFRAFEPFIGQSYPWWFALTVALRNGLWLVACGVGLWDWRDGMGVGVSGENNKL